MKRSIIFAAIALSLSSFATDEVQRSELGASLSHHSGIEPYLTLAAHANDLEVKPLNVVLIDCKDHPAEIGGRNESFCGFTASAVYGWHANPVLVTEVKGYVRKEKQDGRGLAKEDLMIVSVLIKTPINNGLESISR